MSKLSEKLSYLKGLMEGLNLNEEDPQVKVIKGMLEAFNLANDRIDYLEDKTEELDSYVEEIDRDLGELEDLMNGDDEHDHCHCGDDDCCEDYDDEDENVTYECPNCGSEVEFEPDELMSEDEPKCPECGKSMFCDEE